MGLIPTLGSELLLINMFIKRGIEFRHSSRNALQFRREVLNGASGHSVLSAYYTIYRIQPEFNKKYYHLFSFYLDTVPPLQQLKTTQALIAAGVDMGYIRKDYKLVGHRQVRNTECPGDALYGEIQTWPHYTPYPTSYLDLDKVLELLKAGKI